jgi:purine-binding chemotaxis protein CheW
MGTRSSKDVWQRIRSVLDGLNEQARQDVNLSREALEAAWRRRAEELARPTSQAGESMLAEKSIVMRLGQELYAFLVRDVEEILRLHPITPVPCVPPHFLGVINRRGSILPIVDLRYFFSAERTEVRDDSRIVVLTRRRLGLGFLVEGADELVSIPVDSIKQPIRRGESKHEEYAAGVFNLGKKMVVLLDSARLLEDDTMKVE